MKVRAQIGKVLNLDKCIGCHTWFLPDTVLRLDSTGLADLSCVGQTASFGKGQNV